MSGAGRLIRRVGVFAAWLVWFIRFYQSGLSPTRLIVEKHDAMRVREMMPAAAFPVLMLGFPLFDRAMRERVGICP